jgi:hypothetical protein
MSDSKELVPIEVRTVDFYGDQLVGGLVRLDDGTLIYVPVKPICDYLGVDWSSQRRRILRDEVLAEGMVIMTIPSSGGPQRVNCLPLDLLPGFLFGIESKRVRPELQEKIARYRREAFRILWEAFRPQVEPATDLAAPAGRSGAEIAYEIATAVQHLARQQMELERRIDTAGRWARTAEGRINEHDGRLVEHDTRIEALELSIGPRSPIDDEQAAELAAAVRAVGRLLEQRGTGDYRGVYGQLYATFAITSYKNLRRERFEAARAWLQQWYAELSSDGSVSSPDKPGA